MKASPTKVESEFSSQRLSGSESTIKANTNQELITQLNQLIYGFKQQNNAQQIRQFIDILTQLTTLGEDCYSDSEDESKEPDDQKFKGLNHEHFYYIC